jgi:hypothetical protein
MSSPTLPMLDQTNLLYPNFRNKEEKTSRRIKISPISIPTEKLQ